MIGRALAWLPAAIAVSVASASIPIFVLLWAGVTSPAVLGTVDVVAIAIGVAALLRIAVVARSETDSTRSISRRPIYAAIGLAAPVVVLAVIGAVSTTAVNAHGEWDAYAVWNKHARFMFRDTAEWTRALSPLMQESHPDYPLMLPISVMAGWMALGRDAISIPIAIAALFGVATAMTLGASVARERGAARGIAAAAALAASPAFLAWGVAQQADVPLAFFILMTFVAMARGLEAGATRAWWIVAGLSAGLAAWTKNEGLVFVVIVSAVLIVWQRLDRRRRLPPGALAASFIGAAPAIASLILFKTTVLTTTNELAAQPLAEMWRLAQQAPRWQFIAGAIGRELWTGGATVVGVLPIAAGFTAVTGVDARGRDAAVAGLMAVLAALAAYSAVYLVTPYDLNWHVRTSVSRVVLHTLPTAIWALFILARRD